MSESWCDICLGFYKERESLVQKYATGMVIGL